MLDKSYDKELTVLPLKRWLPWIGANYQQKKVLIVGESHYEDDGEKWLDKKDATRGFVVNQGLNSHKSEFRDRRFFDAVERTLLNQNTSTFEQRDKLWNNVAFYNLIQRPLSSSSKNDRPNREDFDKGWLNFLDILNVLQPTVCLKFGYSEIGRLGNLLHNTKTEWIRDDRFEFDIKPYCINLTKEDLKVRIICTHHPTGTFGYDYAEWAKHIKDKFPLVETLFN